MARRLPALADSTGGERTRWTVLLAGSWLPCSCCGYNWRVAKKTVGDGVLAELVRRLVKAYRPERMYLFGSRGRGDGNPDSDYDFLLVVSDDAPPERRRSRLAYQVLRGTGIAADVIVWTRSAFEQRLRVPSSLPATVAREGRILVAS